MKQTNNVRKAKASKKPKVQHLFRGIRDPVVGDASAAAGSLVTITTDSGGSYKSSQTICPLGFQGPNLQANPSTGVIAASLVTVQGAKHPWLYNQARNFERYRVLRYVLIFVGNTGSTATGQIALDSSTDAMDMLATQSLATSTGGKVFDLASSSSKELRFNCDVDTSWKKVSNQLFFSVGAQGANQVQVVPTNSVNDLSPTSWQVTVVGASPSANIGSMYAEYDVEFKDPISYGVNI